MTRIWRYDMKMEELKERLWVARKTVSGLIGPDMWKYIVNKSKCDADMYIFDHKVRIDK